MTARPPKSTKKKSGTKASSRKAAETSAPPPPSIPRRIGWVVLLAVWTFVTASLVSFDRADPPSPFAAPWNDPVANWCGQFGAAIAYHSYAVIGIGVWLMVIAGLAYLIITAAGRTITQPVVRAVGVVLMALAVSTVHGLLLPTIGPLPAINGGLVAVYGTTELATRFNTLGAFLLVFAAFGIGAIVAVDTLVFALPRMLWNGVRKLSGFGGLTLPHISLPRLRFALPFFGSRYADDDEWEYEDEDEEWEYVDEEEEEEAPKRGRRWGRKKKQDAVLSINPDAGGIGAVEAFDPAEYEDEEDDEEYEYVDEEEEDFEDDLDEMEDIAEESAKRQKLSKDELRKKIAKLPVRMAGQNLKIAKDDEIPREENFEGYQFPPLSLLEDPEGNYSARMEKFVREQAEVLEESLQTYKIDGEVVGIDSGPVVTLYAVQLAPGTKVSKVTSVSSDIARSLRAQNIRIVPNMAGRTSIGIEVPNLHKEKVRLKELMSTGAADEMGLPMFLGKDASGEALVVDLTTMPHMLIAGTTGSGKSVCMNSIIMSWLYTKRPDELKLVLVDPKMVELSQFQNIPHLMCPVVTEMGKAAAILEWAVTKMEERYELLREAAVRDISSYNDLTEEDLYERFEPENDTERAKIPKNLPYMVFIIDELADLMMTNKEVEQSIVRIAQKARAVGIHLILATQRPQANVVTGLIKSNMPCRVSFKVASGMDSRIVLDSKGAELLLGQGDMMVLSPHSSEIRRSQGTLVTDIEIRRVSKFLRDVASPTFERSLIAIRPGQDPDAEGLDVAERDPLFDKAVVIMIETGRGSVSLLQRRLAIGYARASRLVDQMGQAGILGEHRGSVARDVLITLEEWEEMKDLEAQAEAEGTVFARSEDGNESADVNTIDDDHDDNNDDNEHSAIVETFRNTETDAEDDDDYEYDYEDVEDSDDFEEEDGDENADEDDEIPAELADEYRM